MPCSALEVTAPISCPVAGKSIPVAEARQSFHYRGGDMSGDYPAEDARYTRPIRPQHTRSCSGCVNCIN